MAIDEEKQWIPGTIMHIGESKHVYGNTGMRIDTYLGDESQCAYQKVRLIHN